MNFIIPHILFWLITATVGFGLYWSGDPRTNEQKRGAAVFLLSPFWPALWLAHLVRLVCDMVEILRQP